MIFDWVENCKQILQTKHFPNSDAQEKKTMLFQHITLFKYMNDVLNLTRNQIFNFWLSTDSIYLQNIPRDDAKGWAIVEFNKIWILRKKSAINFEDTNSQKIYNFPIYQEELDFINSLDCSWWYKRALLLLLGAAKHNKSGLLKLNYTTTAWVEKTIDPNHKEREKMRKLGLLNARYHLFDSFFTFVQYGKKANANFVKVTYKLDKGEIAGVVYSPNYMKDILDLIPEDTIVCPGCGKKFVPTPKQQTEYCSECYKKIRKQDRHKNRMPPPKSKNVIYE